MIIGALMSPAFVFVSAGILLAVGIASFCLFMKINRRNKKVYDRKLKAYNEAVDKIKSQELDRQQELEKQQMKAAAADKKSAAAPAVRKPVINEASYPHRILFMAPNGARYDIPFKDAFTIGRNPRSDFYVKNGTAGGAHCRVIYKDGIYLLQDLGSEGGTFFDGNRIPPNTIQEIRTGVLQIGKVTLFVTIDEEQAAG